MLCLEIILNLLTIFLRFKESGKINLSQILIKYFLSGFFFYQTTKHFPIKPTTVAQCNFIKLFKNKSRNCCSNAPLFKEKYFPLQKKHFQLYSKKRGRGISIEYYKY
ncbi:hypothetical protein CDIK_4214 [Cucumispora dikerogammari]|nr:hypothetical protein CDIK_4214 [Cucumispora dikerogammari]